MTDRVRVAVVRVVAAVALIAAVTGSILAAMAGEAESWWSGYGAFVAILGVSLSVLAWLAIPNQPRNAVLWVLAASALSAGIFDLGFASAILLLDSPDLVTSDPIIPAQLPGYIAVVVMVASTAGGLSPSLLVTFGVLLFPDGRLPSQRWRWLAVSSGTVVFLAAVASAWTYRSDSAQPVEQGMLVGSAWTLLVLCAVGCLVALLSRYRRSPGPIRAQLKWVMWGTSIFVPAVVVAIAFEDTAHAGLVFALVMGAEVLFLTAYGIAVAKYRLYDIDVVISRTVVYGLVVAALAGVYAGTVFLLGVLLPFQGDVAVATSTLAVVGLFAPLRRRIQRLVERHFYRSRYDLRQEVETFSERLREQTDLAVVNDELTEIVERTMHPVGVALWLRPAGPEKWQ